MSRQARVQPHLIYRHHGDGEEAAEVASCSLTAGVRKCGWFLTLRRLLFQAEKAEGYIDLTDFVIDRAIECKKKQ